MIEPRKLKCDFAVNPLAIEAVRPRLGWIVETEKRNQRQLAYQILAASSLEKLAADQGDLWDSGRVESDESIHVIYCGKPLESGQIIFWKVRLWDQSNTASDYSEPASWEMGLLNPSDWQGKWIGRNVKVHRREQGIIYREAGNWQGKWVADSNPETLSETSGAPLLRREFHLPKSISKARAYICGLGYYELYLNGTKVGEHVLDPKLTAYDKRLLYVAYDITGFLTSGANAVGVILGNGWYNHQTRSPWSFDSAPWRSAPKMLLQIHIEYTDGSSENIVSDTEWKMADSPIIYNDVFGGETYDARLEQAGWDQAGFNDSQWQQAEVVRPPFGKLVAQFGQPIKVNQVLKTQRITEPLPGTFVFDLGQNFAGWARLVVEGPRGSEIHLKFSQKLLPDGTIDEKPNRACIDQVDPEHRSHEDIYILKGEGVETWEPRFVYHGFQYVQVTGFPGKPETGNLLGCAVHSNFADAGSFECSNALLNQIWKNARWSFTGNFHGYPTDCPHREKNGWTGDAHLVAEHGIYNYDMAALYEQWLDDFSDVQKENGELPAIVPTANDWGYRLGIAWNSAYFLIPWYLYVYYGDIHILEKHYEGMKRYLEGMAFEADDYIVMDGLDDWVPADEKTPTEVTSTAYYYCDAVLLAKIAGILGEERDELRFLRLADSIKDAFNRRFFNEQTMGYANGTQTALSCALFMGLVDEERQDQVFASLLNKIELYNGHINTGILGAKFVPNVLSMFGRTDVAYTMATQTTFPSWGYWVKEGLSTLSEQWDSDIEATSWIHPTFGDISAWFYKSLAGIQADERQPGFRHFYICPGLVGDLTSVKGQYHSIRGEIVSEWTKEGGRLQFTVQIPGNTTATVQLPAADPSAVFEGGQQACASEGVAFLYQDGDHAVFSIGSGKYTFTVNSQNKT